MAAAQDMQLAQILSDLVSLREGVCTPQAALALVSIRASHPAPTSSTTESAQEGAKEKEKKEEQDPDLRRAEELVHLHHTVRVRCKTGELGRGLSEARRAVEGVMGGL